MNAREALLELGATPTPFICNPDGDIDMHHLRDDKPDEFAIVRAALDRLEIAEKKLSEIKGRAKEKLNGYLFGVDGRKLINYILNGEGEGK